jgi:signal transduction histidine kinase
LSICKAIVEAHKGEITVQSQINEGTTFIIDLDLVTDPAG